MSDEAGKKYAAQKALEWVKEGMVVGLGSGSTSRFFIEYLAEKCQQGLRIEAVASSKQSESLARELGIPLLLQADWTRVDLTVDGADEIDPSKRLIKGAGGALVREKILAQLSDLFVVIADASKCVPKLGIKPLPVEIHPFGAEGTRESLESLGYQGSWRLGTDYQKWVSDNGNYILDIQLDAQQGSPEIDERIISSLPGVIDTGFFFDLADHCLIGYADGRVDQWN